MPTTKQLKASEKMVENGGNVSKAMLAAGYSPATAKTPQKLTQSQGFATITEELQRELGSIKITPKKLARVIKQGLAAKQPGRIITIDNVHGKVEKKTIQMADHMIRHKFLDTALKIFGAYPVEDKTPTTLILAQFKQIASSYMEDADTAGPAPVAANVPEAEVTHAD